MDEHDSAKGDDIPIVVPSAYMELYPTIVPALRRAMASDKPEIRAGIAALKAALDTHYARRLQQLMLNHRLTRTEARMAIYLADGGSMGGYVELFGVAMGTAKSHLKSIYGKTGVNRQPALIALVRLG